MSLGMKIHIIYHALGKVDSIYSYDPIRLEVKGEFSVLIDNFLLLCEITNYFHAYGDICMDRNCVDGP